MSNVNNFFPGLDGVSAAETKISFLDTVQGEIVIKGYDLIELSKKYSLFRYCTSFTRGQAAESRREKLD